MARGKQTQNPLSECVRTRLTEDENGKLKNMCNEHGKTVSEYVRSLIVADIIRSEDTKCG